MTQKDHKCYEFLFVTSQGLHCASLGQDPSWKQLSKQIAIPSILCVFGKSFGRLNAPLLINYSNCTSEKDCWVQAQHCRPWTQQWRRCFSWHFYQLINIDRENCQGTDTRWDDGTDGTSFSLEQWDPGVEPHDLSSTPKHLSKETAVSQMHKSEFAFRYNAGLGVSCTDIELAWYAQSPGFGTQQCQKAKQNNQHVTTMTTAPKSQAQRV